jgi:2-polyprenyl-3-methyl-5-hydroxy-6-metoxy-1,4-benzoquinol methylase
MRTYAHSNLGKAAHLHYKKLQENSSTTEIKDKLDLFLLQISQEESTPSFQLNGLLKATQNVSLLPLTSDDVLRNIVSVMRNQGQLPEFKDIQNLINTERQHPGTAVRSDMAIFDVVPYAMTSQMDKLYREGFGLAIELASTYMDISRIQMASFIVSNLMQEQDNKKLKLSVLALGDGAGIDSIRLANAGFDVDYIDYDQSNMAKLAIENFKTFERNNTDPNITAPNCITKLSRTYDALICLEVIEHVPEPEKFIEQMANFLKPNGVVYISECFNGIEERWPTHLASNEQFSGLLPFMMNKLFYLEGINRSPLGKPYIFRKRELSDSGSVMDLFKNRTVLQSLILHKINLGI